jgi:hypothetical protein
LGESASNPVRAKKGQQHCDRISKVEDESKDFFSLPYHRFLRMPKINDRPFPIIPKRYTKRLVRDRKPAFLLSGLK